MSSTLQPPSFRIVPVRNQEDLSDTIKLFYDYAASLGLDLGFQNFDIEMSSMPGKYAPPEGELLLARTTSGQPVGCVGLRALPFTLGQPPELEARSVDRKICEKKRLYVAPGGRGRGIGKALATNIIGVARQLNYKEIKLDTLPSMVAALRMYKSLGFVETPAYYVTPLEGTHFLTLDLRFQIDTDTCSEIPDK